MKFKSKAKLEHNANTVWEAMRDHLPEIAEYVNDIESITRDSAEWLDEERLQIVNSWVADPPIPMLLKSYIKPEMLNWKDTAIWDEANLVCHWKIETEYFGEQMLCEGKTTYLDDGDGSIMAFEGEVNLNDKVEKTGILSNKMVAGAIEKMMGKMIPNNFKGMGKQVGEFIKAQNV